MIGLPFIFTSENRCLQFVFSNRNLCLVFFVTPCSDVLSYHITTRCNNSEDSDLNPRKICSDTNRGVLELASLILLTVCYCCEDVYLP
jgi:hypothetical protein